jgi:hypothetical protein
VLETWMEGRPAADGSRRNDLAGVV